MDIFNIFDLIQDIHIKNVSNPYGTFSLYVSHKGTSF